MRNICARFAQDLRKILSQCAIYAQDLRKIVPLSPMRNICARFVQDCTSFPDAQYMREIRARLYFFPQCAIYVQDLHKIVLLSPMRNICARFAQDCSFSPMRNICADLCKIVLISPVRNICASFSNAQYMRKICARLYFSPQCAIFAQDCRHYWEKYVTYHISALNLEWYSLHCYFGLPQALTSF